MAIPCSVVCIEPSSLHVNHLNLCPEEYLDESIDCQSADSCARDCITDAVAIFLWLGWHRV